MSETDYWNNLLLEVRNLKNCGLSDEYVFEKLVVDGYSEEEINWAFTQLDETSQNEENHESCAKPLVFSPEVDSGILTEKMIYEKVGAIVGILIDEKWEELIKEVKKIVVFKEGIEEKVEKTKSEISILNKNFIKMKNKFDIRLNSCNENIDISINLLNGVKLIGTEVIPELVECVSSLK